MTDSSAKIIEWNKVSLFRDELSTDPTMCTCVQIYKIPSQSGVIIEGIRKGRAHGAAESGGKKTGAGRERFLVA